MVCIAGCQITAIRLSASPYLHQKRTISISEEGQTYFHHVTFQAWLAWTYTPQHLNQLSLRHTPFEHHFQSENSTDSLIFAWFNLFSRRIGIKDELAFARGQDLWVTSFFFLLLRVNWQHPRMNEEFLYSRKAWVQRFHKSLLFSSSGFWVSPSIYCSFFTIQVRSSFIGIPIYGAC